MADPTHFNAPCPTCEGERYDITYRGAPAEDGGPDPCPTCNGSGTTERRPNFGEDDGYDWKAYV
jgi:DnaJ-class molecular chaperone